MTERESDIGKFKAEFTKVLKRLLSRGLLGQVTMNMADGDVLMITKYVYDLPHGASCQHRIGQDVYGFMWAWGIMASPKEQPDYIGLRGLVRRFLRKDAGYADLREVVAHPPVGSISSGTMRPEDLVPCFMEILREYSPEEYQRIASDVATELDLALCELHDGHPAWRGEFMTWILNEDIWDAMNDIAPDGTYFGSHPGDGASYGYWSVENQQ